LKRLIFILGFFLSLVIRSQSPEPFFYSLNQEYNYSQSTIYSIIQGKDGDLFIGHSEGISRFNGKSFRNYNFRGKGKSLSNLLQLPNGNILATSFYGDLIVLKSDSIQLNAYSLRDKSGRPVLKSLNGVVYLYEKNIIMKLSADSLFKLSDFNINPEYKILDITEGFDPSQLLVMVQMADSLGLITCNNNGRIVKEQKYPMSITDNVRFFDFNGYKYCYYLGLNKIVEVSVDGLIKENSFQLKFNPKDVKWHTPFVINDQYIALLGYDGILIFDNKGRLIKHGLKGYQVSTAILDIEGNLIIGTLNDGVFVIPSLNLTAVNLQHHLERNDKIKRWLRINDTTYCFGTNKGIVGLCYLNSGTIQEMQLPRQTEVQAITYDASTNSLYVFCDLLYKVGAKSLIIEDKYNVTSTKDIKISEGAMYCATSAHLIVIKDNKVQKYFDRNWINTLELDKKSNVLWLGSNNGLHSFNLINSVCKDETIPILKKPFTSVAKVKQLPNSDLLLHAINAGLLLGNTKDGFKYFRKDDAILDFNLDGNYLFILYKDYLDIVDITTNQPIIKLNRSKCLEPSLISGYKYKNGLVMLFSKNYLVYNEIPSPNIVQPKVFLHNISGSYSQLNDSTFVSEYNRNSISFNLEVLPNLRSRNDITLRYRLIDVDEEWQYIKAGNSDFYFKYQNLKSGTYKFIAQAINEDGVESDLFQINLEINPPYWQTWWFVTFIIFLFLMIMIGLYIWRINYLKKQTLLKMERQRNEIRLLSAELTTIRSQMNPHFIFNCLSSIQAKVISSKGDEALEDISRFSMLIRSVLDFSSREYILLNDEINFIRNFLYLEASRHESKMNYTIFVDEAIDVKYGEIPSLITIPILENAIKHGLLHKEGEKKLTVRVEGNNQKIVISIQDNGIGRKKSSEINSESRKNHKSFALDALNKRIERINASNRMNLKLDIIDLEEGTKVVITILNND